MSPSNALLIEAEIETDRTPEARIEISPDQIGRMSQEAIKAGEHTAKLLRDIGDASAELGNKTKEECYRLATDFEQHARLTAQAVVNYAQDIYHRAQQARELRKSLPQIGPRIIEAKREGFQSQHDPGG